MKNKKGFAVSGIVYPLLIITVFLVVQVLFMLQTRKSVLDKSSQELADTIDGENKVYNNEELSTLVAKLNSDLAKTNAILNTVANDSGWKTLTEGINYRMVGKVAFVEFSNYATTKTGWYAVGVLPSEFKTNATARYGASVAFNGGTGNDIMTCIDASGTLSIYTSKASNLVGMFVYPIG